MAVRVDERPGGPVSFHAECGEATRVQQVLTDTLANLPRGEWTEIRIDMSEFAGSQLCRGMVPFAITTGGPLCLSLADVRLVSSEDL